MWYVMCEDRVEVTGAEATVETSHIGAVGSEELGGRVAQVTGMKEDRSNNDSEGPGSSSESGKMREGLVPVLLS